VNKLGVLNQRDKQTVKDNIQKKFLLVNFFNLVTRLRTSR